MGHRVLAQQISKMFGKHMSYLHDKYVVVPNNKANNNIVFACKITLHRQLERNYVLTIYLATPHRKCILYTLLYKQKIKYLSTKICTWEIELWILDFQFFFIVIQNVVLLIHHFALSARLTNILSIVILCIIYSFNRQKFYIIDSYILNWLYEILLYIDIDTLSGLV